MVLFFLINSKQDPLFQNSIKYFRNATTNKLSLGKQAFYVMPTE